MDRPDRIHLRDHVIEADIGAFQSERGHRQRLRFNLTVDLAHTVAGADDHVDAILSYDVLVGAVATTLADQRYNLLETVAERIAAEVLAHPRAACIEVTVEKLDRVPGALGVTITRRAGRVAAEAVTAQPVVVLTGRADAAVPQGAVIVPEAPDLPLPHGGHARRVAHLALDQAAWAMAGARGCDVADSRTELDWAIAEGRTVVWAPARMAADTADLPADSLTLALWLAGRLGAARLLVDRPGPLPSPAEPLA